MQIAVCEQALALAWYYIRYIMEPNLVFTTKGSWRQWGADEGESMLKGPFCVYLAAVAASITIPLETEVQQATP